MKHTIQSKESLTDISDVQLNRDLSIYYLVGMNKSNLDVTKIHLHLMQNNLKTSLDTCVPVN
jgi:hypothetical protein